jgi:hypothetical protein
MSNEKMSDFEVWSIFQFEFLADASLVFGRAVV